MKLRGLPYVHAITDRHGRRRHYFRRDGYPSITLPGKPFSPEFMAAHRAAMSAEPVERSPAGAERAEPGSVAAVLAAYYAHTSWVHDLAAETKRARRRQLDKFKALFADIPIRRITRQQVEKLISGSTANAQNLWLKSLRPLFDFALRTGHLTENPAKVIERARPPKSSGYHSWDDEEIAQYENRWPIGTMPRVALALALFTAQRRTDLVKMGPHLIRGGQVIRVKPQKTSRTTAIELEIPGASRTGPCAG